MHFNYVFVETTKQNYKWIKKTKKHNGIGVLHHFRWLTGSIKNRSMFRNYVMLSNVSRGVLYFKQYSVLFRTNTSIQSHIQYSVSVYSDSQILGKLYNATVLCHIMCIIRKVKTTPKRHKVAIFKQYFARL